MPDTRKLRLGNGADGICGDLTWAGETLEVRNDRFGFAPLFYSESDHGFGLSTSIADLLALGAPAALDEGALAVFLRLGFFLGNDTPFRHIRALPPGATLRRDASGMRIEQTPPRLRPACSSGDPIGDYVELFRLAVARRIPTDPDAEVVVPLSGGRDSRHILLELCAQGRPPSCSVTVSLGGESEDLQVARLVAAAAGVPHVGLGQPRSLFAAESRKNLACHCCADEHSWMIPLADHLAGRSGFVFDGIGGDVLSAGLFLDRDRLDDFEAGRYTALAGRMLGDERPISRLVSPRWYRRIGRDRAVSRLADELAKHADAQNPVGSFYFWNRTRREIALAPYSVLEGGPAILSPYLDDDVYDHLSSLPASLFLDHSFHTRAIEAAYPRFAEIPYAGKGEGDGDDPAKARRFARELSRHLLRRRPGFGGLLNPAYVAPRLARSSLEGGYATASLWLLSTVLYLSQLQEMAADRKAADPRPARTDPPLRIRPTAGGRLTASFWAAGRRPLSPGERPGIAQPIGATR